MALTIGQVADAADVNIQTIRYYERRGLFPTPRRTPAGYRQYADDAVARLRFTRRSSVSRCRRSRSCSGCASGTGPPAMPSSGKRDRRLRSSIRGSATSSA